MTTTATIPTTPTTLLASAAVEWVERLSPAFVRVGLTAPEFTDLADPGLDTRIKLGFPAPGTALPDLAVHGDDWYAAWLALPEDSRPALRTYTIRDLRGEAGRTLLVVDFVVHGAEGAAPGPACRWAQAAAPGDRVLVAGPRVGVPWGGSEFDPAGRTSLLLVGDETAAPALGRILGSLRDDHLGAVFLEVPAAEDILDLPVPPGVRLHWVVRSGAPYGRPLVAAVRRHLGLPPQLPGSGTPEQPRSSLEVDVWETPAFSAAGEDLDDQLAGESPAGRLADTYAWIAGESWLVRTLRRSLVGELGMSRDQVAFMGYWREGVAMRS